MPRLLRPHIPLKVRCRVALRQLGEIWPDDVLKSTPSFGALLDQLLGQLADLLNCTPADLHLDHNPALGAREKVFRDGVHIDYRPSANDPEHLIYREKMAHRIKTNVRGDGAQHPDRVLIKKQRRFENPAKYQKPKQKIKGRSSWPKRPLRGSNPWRKSRA